LLLLRGSFGFVLLVSCYNAGWCYVLFGGYLLFMLIVLVYFIYYLFVRFVYMLVCLACALDFVVCFGAMLYCLFVYCVLLFEAFYFVAFCSFAVYSNSVG